MKGIYKLAEKQIFISLIVSILLLGTDFSFGQKHFYMDEKKIYEKFKIAEAIFYKGKKHFLKGNYKKAEKELKKCIETMPEHVEAHFYLSQILYKNEDFQKALEHIEKAKANFEFMTGLFAYAYEQYISQLREQEDILDSKISKLREKLSAASPEEKSMIEAQIDARETTKNVIRNRLNEPLPPLESIPADYFYFHGNVFFKLKKYQEAYAQYIKAIKINPNHGNAYNNLANLYYMTKQHQKALDCLNKAEANGVKTNPELKKAILKILEK